jgi:4-amino-4-deoxy-L-arabinose transferase-like glycosyltransferase
MSRVEPDGRRWRALVGWVGILFFGAVAALAAALLAVDAWRVVSHVDSLAALRVALVAVAVIASGVVLTAAVAWLAGSGPRGARTATLVALVVVVGVRIIVMLAYDGVLSGEPKVYHNLASAMAAGECCPWDEPISRPPGYAFVLAGAYALTGASPAVAEALNVLFAVATGLVVLALGRHFYGPSAGAVALLLYGLWPAGALMVVVSVPHSAYDLAFAAAAWAVVATPPGWRWSSVAGVLLGLSQYLRPTSFLMLPLLVVARIWGGGRWRGLLLGSAVPIVAGFLLVLVPIMAWNVSTRGALDISTSSFGGGSLYHGTNLASGGRWSRAGREAIGALGNDAWERSRAAQAVAIGRIRDDPVGMTALALRKQVSFWGRETYGVRYGIRRELTGRPWAPAAVLPTLASGSYYVAVLALTALGLYLRRRETDALSGLLVLVVLGLSLLHGFVEVRDRYHSYAIPLLMPVAASAIVAVTEGVRQRRPPRAPPPADGADARDVPAAGRPDDGATTIVDGQVRNGGTS